MITNIIRHAKNLTICWPYKRCIRWRTKTIRQIDNISLRGI